MAGPPLFPPERQFARFILERQRTHRTPAILRLEKNYGPEGIATMAATILFALSGAIVGLTGIVVLFLSSGHGPLLTAGYICLFAAMALEVPALFALPRGSTWVDGFGGTGLSSRAAGGV